MNSIVIGVENKAIKEAALLEEYVNMKQLVGNNEILMSMDLEHIVNCHYELIIDRSRSFYKIKFKGGHSSGTLRKLEQEGVVSIKSHIEFGGGCIEYQAEDVFSGQLFKHTEYPPHWNAEKIARETKEISSAFLEKQSDLIKLRKAIKEFGSENFKLKIIIDPQPLELNGLPINIETKNVHIVTSHPIFESN